MNRADAESMIVTSRCLGGGRREDARIHVAFTEREARSVIRATTLVADLLRPELFRGGPPVESPLVTAYQVLVAACERGGVDLGIGSPVPRAG